MAILETDSKIELLETNSGITQLKEFKYSNNQNLFVPIGVPYHKIVTKSKSVIYQTLSKPQKHSEEILRVKNKTALENYLQASTKIPQRSKYFTDTKVKPKDSDYKKGYFERYFLQLSSNEKAPILEVTKKNFDTTDSMYKKISMRWSLNKDTKEQERLNFNNILRVEKAFPQIRMKIYNFVEFGKES